jgi:hypothetical protein
MIRQVPGTKVRRIAQQKLKPSASKSPLKGSSARHGGFVQLELNSESFDSFAPAHCDLSVLPIYVTRVPAAPIETRSLPALARRYPRDFTFYVADPISSIRERVVNSQRGDQ